MKKYKVLHIITRVRRSGGAEKNTLLTMAGLPKDRFETVLISGRDSDVEYAESVSGCRVIIEKYLFRDISPVKDLLTLYRLYRYIKSNGYDIVHTHLAKAGTLGRIAANWAGAPIIIHGLHGATFHANLSPFRYKFFLFLEKYCAKFTDCFISVGRDLRDRYIEAGVGKRRDYRVIRSGIELDKFLSLPASVNDKPRIGMIASLESRKGHLYALELAKIFPQVEFVFAGDGYMRRQLEAAASDNVRFLGYRSDVHKVFGICDVIILTSLWEGLPQVLVQAAASGRPIVTFAVEGAREVVHEGVNGFVVPIKDVKSMSQRLRFLLSDLKRARVMGRKGRQIVNKNWEMQSMINKTINTYEELLQRSHLG